MPDEFNPTSPAEFSHLMEWIRPEAAVKFLASLDLKQLRQVIEPLETMPQEQFHARLHRLGVLPLLQLINLLNPDEQADPPKPLQEVQPEKFVVNLWCTSDSSFPQLGEIIFAGCRRRLRLVK